MLAAMHAIERARTQGRHEIEPDDLLIGFLHAVSRFGVARIGPLDVDLVALGLRFDVEQPVPGVKPRYSLRAAAVFDRAARVARADGAARVLPIHFLAVLGEPGVPTFERLAANHGLDHARWRAALASCALPDEQRSVAERTAALGEATAEDAGARGEGAARPVDRTPPIGELLTTEQAAQVLGVHIQTVRNYIRGAKLPAYRIAGERAIRIRRADVLALLQRPAGAANPADAANVASVARREPD